MVLNAAVIMLNHLFKCFKTSVVHIWRCIFHIKKNRHEKFPVIRRKPCSGTYSSVFIFMIQADIKDQIWCYTAISAAITITAASSKMMAVRTSSFIKKDVVPVAL